MRCTSLCRAACAALLLLCIAIDLQPAEGFTCSGGTGRAECGVAWPAGGPYYTPSSSCSSCSGCTCPAASCLQVVSACLAAPGLVSYEVGFTGCKGSNTSTAPSAIDWVAFQGVDAAGRSFAIQSSLNPNTTLYTFDNTTACDNVYSANSTSTCCLQRNVNGNGQINQFTVPCGTRPLAWMMDSSFRSCVRPENIPPYVTDTSGPNQCSGAGDATNRLCGPYELEPLTCDSLLPCSGAAPPATRAPSNNVRLASVSSSDQSTEFALPALTSAVVTTTVWTEYAPSCVEGSICRYARNPCELDAYWQSDCTCPELNPLRYGYCRYSWASSDADTATCICGADSLTVTYVAVYYPAYRRWPGYWCDWGNCGNNWGWDTCWRRPCRPICWGWGCPAYPWWLDRPRPVFWPGLRPIWWAGGLGWGCRHSGCVGWPGGIHVGCIGRDCIFGVGLRPGGAPPRLLGNDCRGGHCRLLCGRNGCPGWNAAAPLLRANGVRPRNSLGFGVTSAPQRNFNVPRVQRLAGVGALATGAAAVGALATRPGQRPRPAVNPVNNVGVNNVVTKQPNVITSGPRTGQRARDLPTGTTSGFGTSRRPDRPTTRIGDLRGTTTTTAPLTLGPNNPVVNTNNAAVNPVRRNPITRDTTTAPIRRNPVFTNPDSLVSNAVNRPTTTFSRPQQQLTRAQNTFQQPTRRQFNPQSSFSRPTSRQQFTRPCIGPRCTAGH